LTNTDLGHSGPGKSRLDLVWEDQLQNMDYRPLSLREILGRTFSLYRQNLLLFVGINVLPQLGMLAVSLGEGALNPKTWSAGGLLSDTTPADIWIGSLVLCVFGFAVYAFVYVIIQYPAVYAASDLYLGRDASIRGSLRLGIWRMVILDCVIFLYASAIIVGGLLLVVPGIYLMCRLALCTPAALLENLGPWASLERSFRLTKGNARRSFLIFLLCSALGCAALLVFAFPFVVMAGLSLNEPGMLRMWTALSQVGTFFAAVLVMPIFTIATTIFYYDLRVRKEAFDPQSLPFRVQPREKVFQQPGRPATIEGSEYNLAYEFGPYRLGEPVKESWNLREFSRLEYSVTQPTFEDEKISHAPPVYFLGHPWEASQLDQCKIHFLFLCAIVSKEEYARVRAPLRQ